MEDLDWFENKHESKKKRGGLNKWKIWTDIRICMNLKKKRWGFEQTEDLDWYENKHEFKEKKRGFEQTEDLDWYMNMHEFKEKKMGVWTNGRFGLI